MKPVQDTSLRHPLEIVPTRARVTPPPPAGRFRAVLEDSAGVVLSGLESTAAIWPAGPVVSAAVRQARSGGAVGGGGSFSASGAMEAPGAESPQSPGAGTAGAPSAGGYESVMGNFADDSMRLIMLQEQIQAENRQYSTLSNVLKARHETAKNAIGNLR